VWGGVGEVGVDLLSLPKIGLNLYLRGELYPEPDEIAVTITSPQDGATLDTNQPVTFNANAVGNPQLKLRAGVELTLRDGSVEEINRCSCLDNSALHRSFASRISESNSCPICPQVPQGLTEEQFQDISSLIKQRTINYGSDIRVQGSRAACTARADSDIDIAIRVSTENFYRILNDPTLSRLSNPNPGSALERTRQRAIEQGRILVDFNRLGRLSREVESILCIKTQISVVEIGKDFDQGPWINLR